MTNYFYLLTDSGQPEEGQQSVDEILTTSGTLATPTLSPGQNTDIQVDNTNENEAVNKVDNLLMTHIIIGLLLVTKDTNKT